MGEQKEVKRRLIVNIILNFAFAVFELVGGLLANSLALVSDALHDFTDSAALTLSYFGVLQSEKGPTERKTFGYQRVAVFAALFNGLALFAVTIFIFWRAYQRFLHPEPVSGEVIFIVALFGLLIYGFMSWRLKSQLSDVNIRSVFWHTAEDALGWAGVMIAAIILLLTGWTFIDPLISIFIGLIVLWGVWGILKEAVNILLEGVPSGIDLSQVEAKIEQVETVRNVHDLHVWSLGTRQKALSCHINLGECSVHQSQATVIKIKKILKNRFQITHSTIEAECEDCPPGKVCVVNGAAN